MVTAKEKVTKLCEAYAKRRVTVTWWRCRFDAWSGEEEVGPSGDFHASSSDHRRFGVFLPASAPPTNITHTHNYNYPGPPADPAVPGCTSTSFCCTCLRCKTACWWTNSLGTTTPLCCISSSATSG